jgi:hypothetical protein
MARYEVRATERTTPYGTTVWAVTDRRRSNQECCSHGSERAALWAVIGHLEMELDHGPAGRPSQ